MDAESLRLDALIRSSRPVALIGAGPADAGALEACLSRAGLAVAADGGAATLLAAGRMPDAVIGDLDSLSEAARAALPAGILHRVEEQDSTDFEKCLARIEAPLILAAGFTGGRIDHGLAALAALARPGAPRCVLIGAEDAACALPARIALRLPAGARVSLFPLAPARVRSRGLRWATDGLALAPLGRIGTSNEAAGAGPVELEAEGPGMLLIVPRERLDALLEGLAAAPR